VACRCPPTPTPTPTPTPHLSTYPPTHPCFRNLASKTLVGTLPAAWSFMSNSESFTMSSNSLTGSFPAEVGRPGVALTCSVARLPTPSANHNCNMLTCLPQWSVLTKLATL
jgi:hypothetical protein